MHPTLKLTATLATLGLAASAHAVGITLVNPSFYGQPNSTSQTWADFSAPAGPNAPTTTGLTAGTANYFDRTAGSDGAFIIAGSNPARGRIYSFSGTISPEIDVPATSLGSGGYSTVVLQTQVSGTPISNSTFAISAGSTSIGPKSVSIATQATTGSQGPSTEYDYTVTWSLLPSVANYVITYAAAGTSSSQSVTRVDTFAQTPEPAALSALALGGSLLLRRRRLI